LGECGIKELIMAKVKENNENLRTFSPIEKQLWKSADKLRKNIDAAEYKHVVLGLILFTAPVYAQMLLEMFE
jgi:hypothetical protein